MSTANGYRYPPTGREEDLDGILTDTVGCLRRLHDIYGPAVSYHKNTSHVLFAFGAEYNRPLFVDPDMHHSMGHPGPRNSAHRRFSHGLFGTNGDRHLGHRRMLMPPFRKEAVESYHGQLVAIVDRLLSRWRVGQVLDMAAEMRDFALHFTTPLLFGLDDIDAARAVGPAFDDWLDLSHSVSFTSFLPIEQRPEDYDRLLAAADRLEARLLELIRQREERGLEGGDVLAVLLRQHRAGNFTQDEVRGQVHTLFNAAYHTTTSALTWLLILLAQHPHVAGQLAIDLRRELGGAAPTLAQIPKLDLLDRVIKESLRLLPPVVYVPRVVKRPMDLGPYRVPPEAMVVGSLYISQHLGSVFPEPDRFKPERWLGPAPSIYAYLPFGAGTRLCLGTPMALLILKLALSVMFQRFTLVVTPGARIDRHATLTLGTATAVPMIVGPPGGRLQTSPIQGNIHEMIEMPLPTALPAAA